MMCAGDTDKVRVSSTTLLFCSFIFYTGGLWTHRRRFKSFFDTRGTIIFIFFGCHPPLARSLLGFLSNLRFWILPFSPPFNRFFLIRANQHISTCLMPSDQSRGFLIRSSAFKCFDCSQFILIKPTNKFFYHLLSSCFDKRKAFFYPCDLIRLTSSFFMLFI